MNCPKCNKELRPGSMFCDECGTKIESKIFCPECGTSNNEDATNCSNCGASLTPPVSEPILDASSKQSSFDISKYKKPIIGGVAALLAVGLLAVLIPSGGGGDKKALYLKDDELQYTEFSKEDFEVTSKLLDGGYDAQYTLTSYVSFSKDGKTIFFPDKLDGSNGVTMYYREVNKPNKDAVKIDSDIITYFLNEDGNKMIYLKGDDGVLYIHDMKEKEKVASDVYSFKVSKDFKTIGYLEDDGKLMIYNGKSSEKISSDVEELIYASDDLSTIYYLKEDNLYKWKKGADAEKLASDVEGAVAYDSGEIYYVVQGEEKIDYMDYIIDDKAEADKNIKEPEIVVKPEKPEKPYFYDFETVEEYDVAYDKYETEFDIWETKCNEIDDAYDKAYTAYYEKQYRDEMRVELIESSAEIETMELYYYNGKEATLVSNKIQDVEVMSETNPVGLVYVGGLSEDFEKLNLSDYQYASDLIYEIENSLYYNANKYILNKATLTEFDKEDATMIELHDEDLYYFEDVEDNAGNLYKISLANGKIGEATKVDEEVGSYGVLFIDDHMIYFKDFDSSDFKGDLYVDGKKIDSDVRGGYNISFDSNGKIYYFVDWDNSDYEGTLKVYNKKEASTIADDVTTFEVIDDMVIYLYDMSSNSQTGELYKYDGKATKITDDVSAIVTTYDSTMKGDLEYVW